MRPTRSWEMRKKEGAMTSNIDSLSKIACFMKEMWMTILLAFSACFLKWVLLRRGQGVAGEGGSAEVAAEDGNGAFDKGPGAVHAMHWSGAGIKEIL